MSLYGIDISKFQEVGVQGQDFTIIRATYGTGYVDENCDAHYQLAKQQGKLRGVYHYGYNRLNTAVDEANWFVDNIQGYIGDAILVLDNETTWNAAHTRILHDANDVAWAKAWLDHVYARTGVRPLIYMSASVTTAADWSSVASDYALWCAGYPNAFNVSNPPTPRADGSDMPYDTGAFPYATIWQYSSSAGTLDRDIAYMSVDAWNKFANPNAIKENPQPVPDTPPATPAPTHDDTTETPPQPSQPETPSTPETPDVPTNTSEEPTTPDTPEATPDKPTEETPPKVVVPEPHIYFTLWQLLVAILKKFFGIK